MTASTTSSAEPAARLLPAGIWGFPISPFTAGGALDLEGLCVGIELQIDAGIDAIVANGALAEVEDLDAGEWAAAASAAVTYADRVPVLLALPPDRDAALAAARVAAPLRPAALLVLPPPGGTGAELVEQARAVVEIAGVPAVLYQRGSAILDASEVAEAAAAGAVVGVKDGTRDLRALRRLMQGLEGGITIAAAFEDMTLPYWALGVDALCPASTVHDPAYARRWFAHLQRGDLAAARALLQAFAYPFTDLRLSRPGIDVAVVKEAIRLRGHPAGPVRKPGVALTAAECDAIGDLLRRLDASLGAW